MVEINLSEIYLGYVACLNRQAWPALEHFVASDVRYNDKPIGLVRYREMLKRICKDIPDIYFETTMLVSAPPLVASRLQFDCTPGRSFLGLPVNGKRITFAENAFYRFEGEKIQHVWSVFDKAMIEAQL
jgi:predicted ester cyclase